MSASQLADDSNEEMNIMDKKASATGWLLGLMVFAIVGIGFALFVHNPFQATAIGTSGQPINPQTGQPQTLPIGTTGSTTLNFVNTDAFAQGTGSGGTTQISVEGAPYSTGITTASKYQKLNILITNGSTYHNAVYDGDTTTGTIGTFVVPDSATVPIPMKFNRNSSLTMSVLNTNGVAVLTNTNGLKNVTGATNQSISAGQSFSLGVIMDSLQDRSTQDLRCILEASSKTNTTSVVLSGFGAKYVGSSTPTSYVTMGTNSKVWVYDIDAFDNVKGTHKTGAIQVQTASGKSMQEDNLAIDCLSKEWFLDSYDGKVKYDIENYQGTRQSLLESKYTVEFTA